MQHEEFLCCQVKCAIHTLGQLRKFIIKGNEERVDILDRLGARDDAVAEDMVEVSLEVGGEVIVE